jgi:hypothetical protein
VSWALLTLDDTDKKVWSSVKASYGDSSTGSLLDDLIDSAMVCFAWALNSLNKAAWYLYSAIKCLDQANPQCKPSDLLCLSVVQGVLRLVESVTLGLTDPVTIRASLRVGLPQLTRVLDYLSESSCASVIPSPGEALSAYGQGLVGLPTLSSWLRDQGIDPAVWAPVIHGHTQRASLGDLIRLWRYVGADDPTIAARLQGWGWYDLAEVGPAIAAHDHYDSPDVWARDVRAGALDDQFAGTLGLDQGADQITTGEPAQEAAALGYSPRDVQRAWRSSWRLPSEGELREMLWRLRPDVADGAAVTEMDYLAVLGVSSQLPPWALERVAALAYRPQSESEATRAYRLGLAGREAIGAAMLDSGVSPERVAEAESAAVIDAERARHAQIHGWTLGGLTSALRLGLLSVEQAGGLLSGQGYTADDLAEARSAAQTAYTVSVASRALQQARSRVQRSTLAAYRTGTVTAEQAVGALTAQGAPQSAALALVEAVDLEVRQRLADRTVSALRTAYLRGALSLDQAEQSLRTAGITGERASQYRTEWSLEFAARSPQASVGKILGWFQKGLLTEQQARARLTNLGWHTPDLQLSLAEVQGKIDAADAKAQKALLKTEAQAQKELAKAAKQAATAQKQALATAQKQQSLSDLKTWYMDDVITLDYVVSRLESYDYDPQSIALLVEDWDARKRAAIARGKTLAQTGLQVDLKHQTLSDLKTWWQKGEISGDTVLSILDGRGYPRPIIDRLLTDWGISAKLYTAGTPTPPAGFTPAGSVTAAGG